MRVTNNMILRNSSYNINGTKGMVNGTMNQMTTQKKITKPSDDPVVAIRSLRLSTSLSRVDQYYKKNIPDAKSWLDVTETALSNIRSLMQDVRTQCVNGSTDTLTQDDRNTILAQLKSLQSQIFAEGNADYAGRTVFTGFRTDKELVFTEKDIDSSYDIQQKLSYEDMESFRYYTGNVKLPATKDDILNNDISDTAQSNYYRVRLAYSGIEDLKSVSFKVDGKWEATYYNQVGEGQASDDGTIEARYESAAKYGPVGATIPDYITGNNLAVDRSRLYEFDTEEDWEAFVYNSTMQGKNIGDNDMVLIKSTGELIFGESIAQDFKAGHMEMTIDYGKTGFAKGELKPEYYFDCTDKSNPLHPVTYEKFDETGKEIGYDINYTVSMNQEITVNLEASDAFNSDIQRDVDDMIAAVDRAIKAHDKMTEIKKMMGEAQYADDDTQARLKEWLSAAQKEADYADDHLQKLYSREMGKVDSYLENINLAVSKVGCTVDQIKLTETRMNNQQETIMELQSENDDLDLSEIIIKYTATYNAYQSSLTAAGKLSGMTLLNYI